LSGPDFVSRFRETRQTTPAGVPKLFNRIFQTKIYSRGQARGPILGFLKIFSPKKRRKMAFFDSKQRLNYEKIDHDIGF
jgi:hypothetical protein